MNSFWKKDFIDMETPTGYVFENGKMVNLGKMPLDLINSLDDVIPIYDPPKYYGNAYMTILMEGMVYKHFLKEEYYGFIQ